MHFLAEMEAVRSLTDMKRLLSKIYKKAFFVLISGTGTFFYGPCSQNSFYEFEKYPSIKYSLATYMTSILIWLHFRICAYIFNDLNRQEGWFL